MARMHSIQIIPAHKKYSVRGPWLRRKVSALLRAERCPVPGLNIILTDSARLRSLNRRFRKKDRATDVLSFAFGEPEFLGEIYISLDRARSQARALGCAFPAELWRLVVHGLLHLLGHTHGRGAARRRMEKKELAYA